jgi:hypothetical protein
MTSVVVGRQPGLMLLMSSLKKVSRRSDSNGLPYRGCVVPEKGSPSTIMPFLLAKSRQRVSLTYCGLGRTRATEEPQRGRGGDPRACYQRNAGAA